MKWNAIDYFGLVHNYEIQAMFVFNHEIKWKIAIASGNISTRVCFIIIYFYLCIILLLYYIIVVLYFFIIVYFLIVVYFVFYFWSANIVI